MTLNYVTLTLDLYDGQGNPVIAGTASFTPSAVLTDAGIEIIGQTPVVAVFHAAGTPSVKLLATDNSGPVPAGWTWLVTFSGITGAPAGFSFFLPFTGGASQLLSNLIPVSSGTAFQAYMPLPSGTPSSGQAPLATGSGEASAWGNVAANPMTTSGDTIYGGSSGAVTRLPGDTSNTRKFLREQSSAGVAQPPAWDTIQAADVPTLNQNTSGTAANVSGTVAIGNGGTGQTTQQAALDAIAGATTSTQYLRGTGTHVQMSAIQAGDVPTLNQNTSGTAAGLSATLAIGSGGTGQATQQAAMDALAGATTSGSYLRGNGSHVVVGAIQAGDVPTLNQNTTGTASNITGTLDGVPAPTGNVSLNSHKITSLTNGSASSDAAAFGQIPVVEGTVGNIKPVSTAAALGSSGKWPDSDHVHLGFFGGIFGNGSDGAVTLDGSTTYNGFSSLAGSTYTLTRDVMATSLTVNNTVTLKPANYRIFCQGTLTNNGTISNPGGNAVGSAAGTSPVGSTSFPGGRSGGAGGTGVSGAGGNGTNGQMGNTGGAGGAGTSGAAGTGGTVSANFSPATMSANVLATPFSALLAVAAYNFNALQVQFGGGGGGGGSDASSNAGGGGGSSGNVIAIFAWAVNNGSGTISVQGGNGANAAAGNAGGGGGGSGGAILVYTLSAWTAGTTSIAGGSLGTGHGTGSNGNAGGSGLLLNTVLS